jgi:hypothetical protein
MWGNIIAAILGFATLFLCAFLVVKVLDWFNRI